MNSKIKALGLALIAVFAMSAMSASAAQAELDADFAATSYNAHITANAESNQTFQTESGLLTCEEVTGTAVLEKESANLSAEDITYSACFATALKFPVEVDENGCEFNFTAGTTTAANENTSDGSVHIEGCEGGDLTITIFNFSKTSVGCTIHVPEQEVDNITYHNIETGNGEHAVTIEAEDSPVTSELTEGEPKLCTTHHEDAIYNGTIIAEATNGAGATITGTP